MGIKYSGTTPSPLRGEGWGEGDIGQALFLLREGPSGSYMDNRQTDANYSSPPDISQCNSIG
jgi:hypothetical protein